MKQYGAYIYLTNNVPHNIHNLVESKSKEVTATLNIQYGESSEVEKGDSECDFFVASKNPLYICDFLCELNTYLQENNLSFTNLLAIIDKVDFIQKSKESAIQDTLDFLKNYIIINPGLVKEDEYLIDEISYIQTSNDVLLKTNLNIIALNRMEIKIAYIFDETDSVEFPHVIDELDSAHSDFLNIVDDITKDKE